MGGPTTTLVSLEEYLSTAYEPDMEYVGGQLVRRNVGTQLHSLLQAIVTSYLRQFRKSHRLAVFLECRLLVDAATGKHRIPDVMALELPYTHGRVVVDVPAIVVEIMSPDDRWEEVMQKCLEYAALRVENIVVLDPDNRRQYVFAENALRLVSSISLGLPRQHLSLDLPVQEMFAELDEPM